MKDYAVHLLFHVLVIVVGFAAGIAAGLWWSNGDQLAMLLAAGAFGVGILVLVLQVVYISGTPPRQPTRPRPVPPPARMPPRATTAKRPADATRREAALPSDTLIQPADFSDHRDRGDKDTKRSATEALGEYQESSQPHQ